MFRKCYLFIFFVLLSSGNLFPQVVKYGIGGGFTFLLGSDTYTGDVDTLGGKYGFKSNWNIGAKIKASFINTPLRIAGQINYTSLNGSKENVIVTGPLGQPLAVDLETSGHIWTIAAGAEYLFVPAPISPYVLLNIQLNSISDLSFTRKTSFGEIKNSNNGGTRFGFGLGGGIDFSIFPQFDIDVNATLNFYNVMGKERGEDGISGLDMTLSLLYHIL